MKERNDVRKYLKRYYLKISLNGKGNSQPSPGSTEPQAGLNPRRKTPRHMLTKMTKIKSIQSGRVSHPFQKPLIHQRADRMKTTTTEN